jgi:hypothetical protein
MITFLRPTMLALVLVAQSCNQVPSTGSAPNQPGAPPKKPTNPTQASEVDPGLALGGLTLLAGALTVVRARRRR